MTEREESVGPAIRPGEGKWGVPPDQRVSAQDLRRVCLAFSGAAAAGLLGVLFYVLATSQGQVTWLAGFGSSVLIAGAHALAGGLIGFLFAIPRSRQQEPQAPALKPANSALNAADVPRDPDKKRLSDYAANTNLEQISDWLTKILVGAGLVEFKAIREQFGALATTLAPALGGWAARPVVLCLMAFSMCWGFFLSYLLTRLWLPKALSRAEQDEDIQKLEIEKEAELRALERRAYSFLYEAPPGGYSRAIDAIEGYLGRSRPLPSAWLWLYLACAYGQKHGFEQPKKGSDADLALREHVRNAVARAIRLSPSSKDVLARLYDGTDPNEDDLASFNGDEVLDQLLKK